MAGISAMKARQKRVEAHDRERGAQASARTWCQPPRMARRNGSCLAPYRPREVHAGHGDDDGEEAHRVDRQRPRDAADADGHGGSDGAEDAPRFHWAEERPMAAGRSSGGTRWRNDAW